MSYIEDSIAVFSKDAQAIFDEYACIYQEKEALYLQGTSFLKTRVQNSLAEMLKHQLRTKMGQQLALCRKLAPDEYALLRTEIQKELDTFLIKFRHLDYNKNN
ncbi:MAG: hypothetical protein EOP49_04815 [Sphingobacteriales bacterium]|nr:MAG: hypothetical protein EOP49_04815 [Sphingobacteriales bacterium]